MAGMLVRDIVAGSMDSTGAQILTVYGKVSGRYAVYRTPAQVMIHFADDDGEGVNQRAALVPLVALRGQVDGMIEALRDDPSAYTQGKARDYDRRVANALLMALQGDAAQGAAELASVKADLGEDRASDIRTRHLIYAVAATVAAILASRFLASDWFASAFGAFQEGVTPVYWNAAAVGSLGALFSIALQIRSRQVRVDTLPWDNIMDAVLRIFVGALSAVILIALLKGGFAELTIFGTSLGDEPNGTVLAAFAGGFAERLVADFLSGLALGRKSPAGAAAPPAAAPAASDERTTTGERPSGAAAEPVRTAAGNDGSGEQAIEPDEDETEAGGARVDPATRAGALDPVG